MDIALKDRTLRGEDQFRWLLLALPIYFYIVTAWLIRPLSVSNIALAYAVPLSFVTGLLFFQVPRLELIAMLRRVRVELLLALIMALLSILSVINSSEPFKIFRVLFPSILPILLFCQLVALRAISPQTVERIPRVFLAVGIVFTCVPFAMSLVSGGMQDYVMHVGYRYKALFDNANQFSVMVAVLIPLITCEVAISKERARRWLWIGLLVLFLYFLARSGSKTALFITLGYLWLFYLIVHWRFHSFLKNVFLISILAVAMVGLGVYGIPLATAIDPILGAKIEAVFSDGLKNYATIESREILWSEAWRQGTEHWLIGTGAGEPINRTTHAHNLILDYFRGTGVFGAFAIMFLCARILWRAVDKAFVAILSRDVSRYEMRIFACYASAAVYVLCNQLSNSFGPASISALWLIYLPAVLSEPERSVAVTSHRPRTLRTQAG